MNVTVPLDGSLLARRQQEWEDWLSRPHENPLSTRAEFGAAEVVLENAHCVYVQDSRYSDGLRGAGHIVTKAVRQTVFDLTPDEVQAAHALLHEVRAHLDATLRPDGYTVGWNVFPAGGAHIPHVHLHVIPRWNADLSAGAGLRYFLKAAAGALDIRPARPDELERVRALADTLTLGASSATSEGSSYWLALRGDDLLGCIGLEHGPAAESGGASLIRTTCVRPDVQGQGLGLRLARTALDEARKRDDRAVYLFSSHAGAYWQRLGFGPVPVEELAAALPDVPQVRSGLTRGWIHGERAWKLDLQAELNLQAGLNSQGKG